MDIGQAIATEQNTAKTAVDTPPVIPPVTPTDTPPSTDPPPTPEGQQFNQVEFLKTHFGVENIDEVKTKWTALPDLEQQAQRAAEIQKEYETFKANPFQNDTEKLFIESMRKGVSPKLVAQIYDLKPEALSLEQKWKIHQQFTNPTFSEKEIDALYQHKFGYDSEDPSVTEQEKLLKSAALKSEADIAEKGLTDYMNKALNPVSPDVEKLAAQAKQDQLAQSWTKLSGALANGLKEVSNKMPLKTFGAKDGEEKEFDFKYVVPEAETQAIMQEAIQAAVMNGISADENGLKQVGAYAQNLLWAKHGPAITKAYLTDAVTHLTKSFEEIDNPTVARQQVEQRRMDNLTAAENNVIGALNKNKRSN